MMRYPPSHVVSGELAFLNVHRYMVAAGIPVPLVYLHIPEEHILFLEDGGDRTLEDIVEETGFSEKVGKIYEEAIDHIVAIQAKGSLRLDWRALPAKYSFDFDKLIWEMDFFATWGLEKLESIPDKKRVAKEFISQVEPVINDLIKLPLVLTHRDYHSRNIMVLPDGSIRIIDFQDARMGNVYYDLSSLLFDSYVVMPSREREKLFIRHTDLVKDEPFATWKSNEENWNNLYTMAIQRNLKALGTFFYMFYGTGNDRYLRYIEPTITYLRENPVLSEKYGYLSAHILPLLTALAGQINIKGGGSIEGYDPRSRSGDKAPSSDV
jgi:aminoglycoside/choline kinase family phosphotransferase